jgi:hypothetical protein
MHPLLPFYSIFSLYAFAGLRLKDGVQRGYLWQGAWGAMALVLIAIIMRPIEGDTSRYQMSFLQWRDMTFTDVMSEVEHNWLFAAINWVLGQFGDNLFWLIIPVTLLCAFMLYSALHQTLPKTHATVGILLYSVYPYFVFYVASGIKQAIAMALLMQAYICFHNRQWRAWLWLLLAPGFHSGAALVFPFLLMHRLTWRRSFGYSLAMKLSLGLLAVTTLMSATNLNQELLTQYQNQLQVSSNYEIYFQDAAELDYRAGFRIDFTLFSILPIFAAVWLRRRGRGLSSAVSGWWLNLYILLVCIYQLFAFAPFADRFAGFGWHLMPLILLIMVAETGRKFELQIILLAFAIFNVLILQFYTGSALRWAF